MVRHLTREASADAYTRPPATDDHDPSALVTGAVETVLTAAESWLGWDGRPVHRDGNAWTPHKALRRTADHLLDHLAEIECRLAGHPTIPDRWHGRMATTDADFARFTEIDLDEATSRLTRLAACYAARLGGLTAAELDAAPPDGGWTLRQVVHHVAGVVYYAEALEAGDLPRST